LLKVHAAGNDEPKVLSLSDQLGEQQGTSSRVFPVPSAGQSKWSSRVYSSRVFPRARAGERAVNRGDARKIRCQVAPRAHICAWKGSYQKCQIICQIVGDCFFSFAKKIKMPIWFRELLEMLSSLVGQC